MNHVKYFDPIWAVYDLVIPSGIPSVGPHNAFVVEHGFEIAENEK